MDRYNRTNESQLPSGLRELSLKSGQKTTGTVRRYSMTKKSRENWLDRFMNRSKEIDPDVIGAGRINLDFAEKEKSGAKRMIAAFIIICAVLLTLLIGFLMLDRMKIQNVVVNGDTGYTADMILDASGMSYGQSLLIGRLKAKDPVDKLTLLESCKISLELPGTVVFTVKEAEPVAYASIYGSFYSLSSTLRVIAREDTPDAFIEAGLVRIELPAVSSATSGNILELEGNIDTGYICDFLKMLSGKNCGERIDKVSLDKKYGIEITIDEDFTLFFGSPDQSSLKLDTALRIIEEETNAGTQAAFIDLSDPGTVGVRRLEASDLSTGSY